MKFKGFTGANKGPETKPLIKNIQARQKKRDFSLNAVGLGLLGIGIAFILGVLYSTGSPPSLREWGVLLGIPAATLVLLIFFPRWTAAVKIYILLMCIAGLAGFPRLGPALIFAALAAVLTPAIQKRDEWERAIILRFGKFHRVRGPGLFLLFPLADRAVQTVDIRIRVTDFSAQETLTGDSVTVTVDALCFWLVWDPEKAVLEVEDYQNAVILSAKTALRNSISSHDLSTFLEHGEIIQKQIQEEVDKKTTEWGITIQHIEITDIQIPDALQGALSRIAQAEREKKGRILLAEAEIEIAGKLEEAVSIYIKNEPAMKLKILSILNEGLKAGNSMMLVPNSITEELKTKDIFGLEALTELRQKTDREPEANP
ncbi:MAG: slipin family protein [Spirochaetaceae bacterium]|jgi:regulator of protease activity HflC (stomatin/prohibitin superfamily)|nr:slipin family protein [Spirochaetaceae bacterium]